jgi:hypothetical protein
MTTRTRVRVATYTESVTHLAQGVLDVFEAIVVKLGLSTVYLEGNWDALIRGLKTWLNGHYLEAVCLEIIDRHGTLWSRCDLELTYHDVGLPGVFYVDLEVGRFSAIKFGSPPPWASYRVVVLLKPGAPAGEGWGSTSLLSTENMLRIRVGSAIGSPHIGANLDFWKRP